MPLTITDARGKVTTNEYNAGGNLTKTTDPSGAVTEFTYDSAGRPTHTKDALNQTVTNTYGIDGRLASTTNALGHTTSWTYDSNGNRLTQTVTRTKADSTTVTETTSYTYDAENRLTKTTFPDGTFVETTYNAFGKQATIKDQLGRVTSFAYDDRGNLTRTDFPVESGTGVPPVFELLTYDAENRVIGTTDRAGHTTSTTYDALGRATKVTYADGNFTQTAFDAAGRVTSTTDARGNLTRNRYDDAGRRIEVRQYTDQSLAAIDSTFSILPSALGVVSTHYSYDEAGNLTTLVDALNHSTSYTYDDRGLRTTVTFPDGTTQLTTFDALGRKVAATDQAGKITRWRYDALGHLIEVRQYLDQSLAAGDSAFSILPSALGVVSTRYQYDEMGNQVAQIDGLDRVTRYEYDAVNRRIKRTLPGGQVETCTYDNAGNLSAKTDFNGYTTSYVYDAMSRLTEKRADATHPSLAIAHAPAKFTYTYNALGQRTTATVLSATGATLYTETLAYDTRNRPTSRATSNGTLAYAYDAQGNLALLHSNDLAAGVDVAYAYDPLNRLSEVSTRDPADGIRKFTDYIYDAVGNLGGVTLPNDVTSLYTYNTLNQLTNLTVGRLGTPVASYAYTLDAAGHRTSVLELNGRKHDYAYDYINRLTNETITIGTGDPAIAGTVNYTLDKVGNRLARNSSVPSVSSAVNSFDSNDRLTSDTCDANGNTLQGGTGVSPVGSTTDTYDFENRLIRRTSSSTTINVLYDCDGNRVSETVGAQTVTFLVDTLNPTGYAQVVEERVNGVLSRTYAHGHTLLSQTQATLSGWTTSYFSADGHGSIRQLTDALGTVTDTYSYDAFGVLIYSTTTQQQPTFNRYRYAGEQYDDDLGLIYLRARYMNPNSGRFWSADSFEGVKSDPQSLHRYLYAHANPVTYIDPSGFLSRFEYAAIGRHVHWFIGLHFKARSPAWRVSDITLSEILSDFVEDEVDIAIRPDLVDKRTKEAYEIKPNKTGEGAQKAKKQLQRYIDSFSAYGVGFLPGTSYEPPSVIPPPPSFSRIKITAERTEPGVILYTITEDGDDEKVRQVVLATAAVYTMAHLQRLVSVAVAAQNAGVKGRIGLAMATRGL